MSSSIEEAVVSYLFEDEETRSVEVSKACIKRLRRIAFDTRCVLTEEDANFLANLADILDGESLPDTQPAPHAYPFGVVGDGVIR